MIGTVLSVMGGINTAFDFYKSVGTVVRGDDTERLLNKMDQIHHEVVRLHDNIYFAPSLTGVTNTTDATHAVSDPRTVRELLEPVQRAVGGRIVSSQLILTPQKMEAALQANPWAVLVDIRPQNLAVPPINSDMIPVMFVHGGTRYVGWQMRGALPALFNCEWHDLPGLRDNRQPTTHGRQPTLEVVHQQAVRPAEIAHGFPPPLNASRQAHLLSEDSRRARVSAKRARETADLRAAHALIANIDRQVEEDKAREIHTKGRGLTSEEVRQSNEIIANIDRNVERRQWFVAREGKQFGPMREAEFPAVVNGLQLSDLVWRDGLPDWQPADEVFPRKVKRGLFSFFK